MYSTKINAGTHPDNIRHHYNETEIPMQNPFSASENSVPFRLIAHIDADAFFASGKRKFYLLPVDKFLKYSYLILTICRGGRMRILEKFPSTIYETSVTNNHLICRSIPPPLLLKSALLILQLHRATLKFCFDDWFG